ncbi:MAG: LysR substrate-binding domain-containing protein [Pseudoclavibacter sp.]|nr:LysR substrate-binding domain-containing protein [Pseudoclavibacter sp.]
MIDTERLRVLVVFAELGTLTATAERLHCTQPTVSHHLQRLQAETGSVLVAQAGRRLRLTREGRLLAERGAAILAALERAERELRAMTSLEAGLVRLAAFPSAVPTIVPELLAGVAARAPGLAVEILDAEPPEAAGMLRDGEADLALAFTYPGGDGEADLHRTRLGRDRLLLVEAAGRSREPGPRTPLRSAELAAWRDRNWLAGCERCRAHLLAACKDAGFAPRIGYRSDDVLAVQALVATGQGVTILPGLALRAHRGGGLRTRPLHGRHRTVELWAATAPATPAVRLVHEQAARAAAEAIAAAARD